METKVCKCCGRELPIQEFYARFKSKDGHMAVCKECFGNRLKKSREEKKKLIEFANKGGKKLSDYTPRELMCELRRRGFDGKLEYIEKQVVETKHVINISKLD